MGIFNRKKDPIFDAVLSRTKELNRSFEDGAKPVMHKNRFVRIIDGDSKSPMVMGLGLNKHLIFYPKHSTPYLHKYETSIKFVEILSGKINDRVSGMSYKTGDRFKIYPGQLIQPYTTDSECYVRVCVTEVDSVWENVCN